MICNATIKAFYCLLQDCKIPNFRQKFLQGLKKAVFFILFLE